MLGPHQQLSVDVVCVLEWDWVCWVVLAWAGGVDRPRVGLGRLGSSSCAAVLAVAPVAAAGVGCCC